MVAEEKHQDGNSHIHAYLLLEKKANITNPNKLDLIGPCEETYHGNYQSARNRRRILTYIMKDGDFLTNIDPLPSISTAKKSWTLAINQAKEGKTKEALDTIIAEDPKAFVVYNTQVKNCLRGLKVPSNKSFKTWEDYKKLPEWTREKTLIIWGEAGVGKTSLAKLLLPKGLVTSHMDNLKRMDERYEGIIFDDMSFLHLPREAQIHIVDNYDERQIHCRHTIAVIPAFTPKIMTTNLTPSRILATTDPAIARRIESWELVKGKNKVKAINLNKFI